jgi:hypothetical protein
MGLNRKRLLTALYFSNRIIQSTIFDETARAVSCTSGIALAASGVPLPSWDAS